MYKISSNQLIRTKQHRENKEKAYNIQNEMHNYISYWVLYIYKSQIRSKVEYYIYRVPSKKEVNSEGRETAGENWWRLIRLKNFGIISTQFFSFHVVCSLKKYDKLTPSTRELFRRTRSAERKSNVVCK